MNSDPFTLHAKRGTSFFYGAQTFNPTLANEVATPRDLTGATVTSTIRNGPTQAADPAPVPAFTIAVLNATKGAFELRLPADHALVPRTYFYEVEVVEGTRRDTVLEGRLEVAPGFA